MNKVFYFATLGMNFSIENTPLIDIEKEKSKITDPISYGIYEIFKRWNVLPHTTLFYTTGKGGGSEENLRKFKTKFSNLNLYVDAVEIYPFDIDKNNVKLSNYLSEKFKEITKEDNFYIVINPTTGTNPMTISLFSATIDNIDKLDEMFRIKIYYIKEFKDIKGEKGNSESMDLVEIKVNEINNRILLRQCKRLIEESKFGHVYTIIENYKSNDPLLNSILDAMKHLSKGLHYWDQFNHKQSLLELQSFLDIYYKLKENYHLKEEFIQNIKNKIQYVRYNNISPEKLTIFHVVDIFNNHLRRDADGDNLGATIRLYRTIETYLEYLLLKHDFDAQMADFSIFTAEQKEAIKKKYESICSLIEKVKINPENLFQKRIYLKEMIAILSALDDKTTVEFLKLISIRDILFINNIRNQSYLTHNLMSIIPEHDSWKKIKPISKKLEEYLKTNYPKEFDLCTMQFSL